MAVRLSLPDDQKDMAADKAHRVTDKAAQYPILTVTPDRLRVPPHRWLRVG